MRAAPGTRSVLADWGALRASARGGTVYFNAWGGDDAINRYLAWAAEQLRRDAGVTLVQVKVGDIAESVARVLAERAAGRDRDGSIDLLWLNGENFASLKRANLLYGPWADALPNARLIDTAGNATTVVDFGMPTEGYEVAWGTSRLTFFYDSARVPTPPRAPAALLDWAVTHPGRFTYPRPPDFLGTSFLKQLLLVLTPERRALAEPPGRRFETLSAPLWSWLDRAHPTMWRRGRLFPPGGAAQRELLAVGELDWALAFNPMEGERAIRRGEFPRSIRATAFAAGALANSHFLAIPYNARDVRGALVVADFLLSPQAQARKADVEHWGDPTVLAMRALSPAERALFGTPTGYTAPPPTGPVLAEPHAAWTAALERAWLARYGVR